MTVENGWSDEARRMSGLASSKGQGAANNLSLNNCRYCQARENGVCGALDAHSPGDATMLERLRRSWRRVQPGETVYHQGDQADLVGNVIDGWIMLTQDSPEGRHQILDFILPGGVFGIEPCEQPYGHTAIALTPATICIAPRAAHDQIRRESAAFNDAIECALACVVRRTFDELASIAHGGAQARVAHLLFSLAVRSTGRRPEVGDAISIPLQQGHIADAVGLTAVHVSRVLAALREERLLEFRGQTLRILNPQAVEALADVSHDTVDLWIAERLGCWPEEVKARRA